MTAKTYTMVGMQHRGSDAVVSDLHHHESLLLLREPGNAFDRNAIQVWARGQHVAFIPKKENVALAALMDERGRSIQDFKMNARFVAGKWPRLEVVDAVAPAPEPVHLRKTRPFRFEPSQPSGDAANNDPIWNADTDGDDDEIG